MPMVGSMLGGAGMNPGGVSGTGSGGSAAASVSRQGTSTTSADGTGGERGMPDAAKFRAMLGEMMSPEEADRWMQQIAQDRQTLQSQGTHRAATSRNRGHSAGYTAGSIPEEAGKGLFGM
jgi:hypothetical protein